MLCCVVWGELKALPAHDAAVGAEDLRGGRELGVAGFDGGPGGGGRLRGPLSSGFIGAAQGPLGPGRGRVGPALGRFLGPAAAAPPSGAPLRAISMVPGAVGPGSLLRLGVGVGPEVSEGKIPARRAEVVARRSVVLG